MVISHQPATVYIQQLQELTRRWDSERELLRSSPGIPEVAEI